MALHGTLKNKTYSEQANLKGQEIARLAKLQTFERTNYDIEIVELGAIENGVQVYLRAFHKNGKQIGFGEDGTVDLERFVIIQPSLLVADPAGDILFTNTEGQTERYREDAQEALLQTLEHTISVKKEKFADAKIVAGKRGNTTTTVFPSTDGRLNMENQVTWAAARDGTSATFLQQPAGTNETSIDVNNQGDADPYWVRRYGGTYDTSSIPDTDVISSVTFSLYINTVTNTDNDGDDYLSITQFSPASESTYVAADIDNFGSTEYVTGIDFGSITTGQYTNLTGNASGIAAINKTGNTVIYYREGHDILNNAPASSTQNALNIKTAAETGTASDPKMVIEHAAPTSPSSSISSSPSSSISSSPSTSPSSSISSSPSTSPSSSISTSPSSSLSPSTSISSSISSSLSTSPSSSVSPSTSISSSISTSVSSSISSSISSSPSTSISSSPSTSISSSISSSPSTSISSSPSSSISSSISSSPSSSISSSPSSSPSPSAPFGIILGENRNTGIMMGTRLLRR